MNRTILFFTFDKVITESAICVCNEFAETAFSVEMIATNPAAEETLRANNIPYAPLSAITARFDDNLLNRQVKPILEKWSKLVARPESKELLRLESMDMITAESDIFLSLKEAFRMQETVNRLLDEHEPKAAILMHDYGILEKTVVAESAARSIPSVVIQHGFDPYERLDPEMNSGFIPWRAVHGYWDKENYMKWEYPKDKIWVTGQPRFDCIPGLLSSCVKEDLYGRFGLNKTLKHALLILPLEEKENHYKIVESLRGLPEVHILIKAHPRELSAIPEDISRQANVSVFAEEDIRELMLVADVVLVGISTSFFEAALMGKDIILLEDKDGYSLEPTPAIPAADIHEIPSLMKIALTDQDKTFQTARANIAEFIRKYYMANDGKASKRIVEKVVALIGKTAG